ncbi:tyrosine-type recombinase/integrase [Azospirillum sp. 11R-A]|uniref:tyrosine-type recombinase/integrase n=1 Tax=Azospirillum sp. 11R-A TaxID=3111634 RepID=UPI003C27BE0F
MDRPLPPSDVQVSENLPPSAPAEDLVTPTVLQALETADRLIERSLADGTRAVYARAWARFAGWCQGQGMAALPATPATLAAFLAHHADPPPQAGSRTTEGAPTGLSPSRLEVVRAAVRREHTRTGHPDPGADPRIGQLLRGVRRSWAERGQSRRQVEALTASSHGDTDVPTLRLVVEAITPAEVRGVRDTALVLVGFAGALRRSELCSLTWGDVRSAAGGLTVTLRTSKTDRDAKGQSVGIPRVGGPLCPVAALTAWRKALLAAGHTVSTSDPVFRDVSRWGHVAAAALHPSTVARIVKRLVAAVPTEGLDEELRRRLDPARYAGHSLRAGFVTTAAIEGKDIIDILMTTRHAEPRTVIDYVRTERLAGRNAVRGALARPGESAAAEERSNDLSQG